ncbi:MAG TPA: hypothetical protein PLG90_13460, partial [Ignavibacteria bacterium]|nr:hypothetical protein [Ignavibacteria bacterium]
MIFETKITEYVYNSSNQLIYTSYQYGGSDFRKFRNVLDSAGRLKSVDVWDNNENPDPDNPGGESSAQWINFTSYQYNQNSQILRQSFNGFGNELNWNYSYNPRNWISVYEEDPSDDPGNPDGIFKYILSYEPNGNISSQVLDGSYKNNFSNTDYLSFQYTYDLSNRLLNTEELNIGDRAFSLDNTYDKDGNILTLQRFNSSGSVIDDFGYSYYTGQGGVKTNKLKKVSG